MSVVANLKAARELIARPGGWHKFTFLACETENLLPRDFDGCACCSEGAIAVACGAREFNRSLYELESRFLLRAAQQSGAWISIWDWNDAPERTQAEVVATFDRAIALAEAEAR